MDIRVTFDHTVPGVTAEERAKLYMELLAINEPRKRTELERKDALTHCVIVYRANPGNRYLAIGMGGTVQQINANQNRPIIVTDDQDSDRVDPDAHWG